MARAADRRAVIADAVIAVLAERGSRGLTHRAVDEVAGLPPGSTSYYFRSRAELLAAAVPRLAELDLAALDVPADPRERLVLILGDALHGEGRRRTLARYELVLEAGRRPEIHRALATGTERLLEGVAGLFPATPPEEARTRARDVLAFVDGLLLANVTSPEHERQSPAELADALARVLDPWTTLTA
jgi:DNA-binding transcriptional regulator YbjK